VRQPIARPPPRSGNRAAIPFRRSADSAPVTEKIVDKKDSIGSEQMVVDAYMEDEAIVNKAILNESSNFDAAQVHFAEAKEATLNESSGFMAKIESPFALDDVTGYPSFTAKESPSYPSFTAKDSCFAMKERLGLKEPLFSTTKDSLGLKEAQVPSPLRSTALRWNPLFA